MNDRAAQTDRRSARAALRVLLLGARGRLGGAIAASVSRPSPATAARAPRTGAEPAIDLFAPPREALALDVTAPDEAVARWFGLWRPDAVVNCIALSDVDRCETEPALAQQVNTALPAALARAAERAGARLIHFSTDFVFDGALRRPYREDDTARPLSVYGHSKLAGERAIADTCSRHWVFRVSWLYGAPRANLAADLLDPVSAGRVFRLATDRLGVPNPVQLLATEVAACIARDARHAMNGECPAAGLYHLSCHGTTSWHAFALAFVREAIRAGRLDADRAPRIEGIEEATLARPAQRPAWSALDPARYEQCFGRLMPDWEAAIALSLPGQDCPV